jgi:thioredoxin 1
MPTIHSATDASFASDVLDSDKTVLVEFWAEWCGPCRALAPVLQAIADEHEQALTIVKINADDNQATSLEYRAMALPMMKVFQSGEAAQSLRGFSPSPTPSTAPAQAHARSPRSRNAQDSHSRPPTVWLTTGCAGAASCAATTASTGSA